MTVNQLVAVLVARWRLLLLTTCSAGLAVWLASTALPKAYTATAAVLVDLRAGDAMGNSERAQVNNQALMATQLDLMSSERVAKRVVEQLGLERDETFRQRWRKEGSEHGQPGDYIARQLLMKLDLRPSRDSNVVNVSFTAADPLRAHEVANAFANAFIEVNLDIRVNPARQLSGLFDERSQRLRQDLESAQAKLSAYQRANGLLNTAEGHVDLESAKLSQLTTQLLEVQEARVESASRKRLAAGNSQTSPDILNNPAVIARQAEVAAAQTALEQLGERLGERHPDVQSARLQLSSLRSQLDAQIRIASRAAAGADKVLAKREEELQAAVAKQRERVVDLGRSTDQLTVLQRDVENAQRALELAAGRQAQTSLESQLKQANVYFLNPATVPTRHAKPKELLNGVSAALLSLLLTAGWLLSREHQKPLVRNTDDLLSALDLPLMASLPRADIRVGNSKIDIGFLPATSKAAETVRGLVGLPNPPKQVDCKESAGSPRKIDGDEVKFVHALGSANSLEPHLAHTASDSFSTTRAMGHRPLGEILVKQGRLDSDRVGDITDQQQNRRMRFGEIAVALKLASKNDVELALAQQFDFPYLPNNESAANPELLSLTRAFGPYAEQIRSLRFNVRSRLLEQAGHGQTLALVSLMPGDGRSMVAANLAVACAQLGHKTLLIDADLRSPRVHELFELENRLGLSNILSGSAGLNDTVSRTLLDRLHVLTAGSRSPNPQELLERPALTLTLMQARNCYDIVILDCSPSRLSADPYIVARRAGHAALVVRMGHTPIRELQHMAAALREADVRLIGTLVNDH